MHYISVVRPGIMLDNSNLLHPDTFTVEAWVRPSAATALGIVYGQQREHNGTGINFAVGNLTPGIGMNDFNQNVSVGSSQTIALGVWSYIVSTYDGNMLKIYLNGVETGSNTIGALDMANVYGGGGPFIGREFDGSDGGLGTRSYEGDIDEVAFYGRVLSAAEILEHFVVGSAPEPGALALLGLGLAGLGFSRRKQA